MTRYPLKAVLTGLLFVALLLGAASVQAHGGGELVVGRAEAGPYRVSIWVNPPEPTSDGPVHLTVGVANSAENAPILDAAVQVTLRDAETGRAVASANATTEASINRLYYETDVALSAGDYTTIVTVLGDEGNGEVEFPMTVTNALPINWLYVGLGGLALVLVLVVWRSRNSAEIPEPRRRKNMKTN